MKRFLKISVEGDFIHSFIYSGTLFLVGGDSVVRTYDWRDLVCEMSRRQLANPYDALKVSQFLLDSRKFTESVRNIALQEEVVVNAKELSKCLVGEISLNGWPADVYVYSDRFYAADEQGVLQIHFDFQRKKLEKSRQFRLMTDRVYSISPNDSNRVAMAAGLNGVFTAAPTSGQMKSGDLFQILEVESYDCEWMNQVLIINTDSGPHAATFRQLPRKPDNPSPSLWKAYNKARHSGPQGKAKLASDGNDVCYAWLGGTKLFKVAEDGGLTVSQLPRMGAEAPSVESLGSSSVYKGQASEMLVRLLSIRAASFGSVAEAGERLLVLSESGIEQVTSNPVSWRVFPRAKMYLNHLHVVQDDLVQIFAYFPPEDEGKIDLFSVDNGDSDNTPAK